MRTAGLVITRQRAGTATGVVFVALEDETGDSTSSSGAAWSERQRKELLGSRLLEVISEVQREGRVVHVPARKLRDHARLLGRLATQSQRFPLMTRGVETVENRLPAGPWAVVGVREALSRHRTA